jgi:hypothetical protein
MPKPVKKKRPAAPKRRPTDVNQWARQLVDESTAEPEPEALAPINPAALSAYMSTLGKKGGAISGGRRKEMPVDVLRRVASIAARARWAKRKAAKKR